VKGYDGVLIHCGNTDKDTEGCILVGYNKEVGKVVNSQAAFEMLYKKYLLSAKKNNEHVTIKIC
jgi:23S rRNA-/tRNA-specific pseudouridylate synthase